MKPAVLTHLFSLGWIPLGLRAYTGIGSYNLYFPTLALVNMM